MLSDSRDPLNTFHTVQSRRHGSPHSEPPWESCCVTLRSRQRGPVSCSRAATCAQALGPTFLWLVQLWSLALTVTIHSLAPEDWGLVVITEL